MSVRNTSSLLPPAPLAGTQSAQLHQSDQQTTGVARLHSVATGAPHVSIASTSNILRSLSTIHRSASVLPASLLDLDVASTAGLQVGGFLATSYSLVISEMW